MIAFRAKCRPNVAPQTERFIAGDQANDLMTKV